MNILHTLAQYEYETYDYETYSTGTTVDEAAAAAALGGFLIFNLLFAIASYIITAIFLGMILKKAGLASWPAWVPVYNTWKMLEIGGQPGFWSILMLIPFVNIVALVFFFIAAYHIGLKLEKPGVFVLLAIFLTPVWLIWLGVDKSTWHEDASPAKNLAKGPKPTPAA